MSIAEAPFNRPVSPERRWTAVQAIGNVLLLQDQPIDQRIAIATTPLFHFHLKFDFYRSQPKWLEDELHEYDRHRRTHEEINLTYEKHLMKEYGIDGKVNVVFYDFKDDWHFEITVEPNGHPFPVEAVMDLSKEIDYRAECEPDPRLEEEQPLMRRPGSQVPRLLINTTRSETNPHLYTADIAIGLEVERTPENLVRDLERRSIEYYGGNRSIGDLVISETGQEVITKLMAARHR